MRLRFFTAFLFSLSGISLLGADCVPTVEYKIASVDRVKENSEYGTQIAPLCCGGSKIYNSPPPPILIGDDVRSDPSRRCRVLPELQHIAAG